MAERHAQEGPAALPIMGHDVLVSNLWEVRDFWAWLAPGIRKPGCRDTAVSQGAYVHYDNLRHYRDYLIKAEAPVAPAAPAQPGQIGPRAVGLWAKQFMTSHQYEFKGTLLVRDAVDQVVGDTQPAAAATTAVEDRLTRESTAWAPILYTHVYCHVVHIEPQWSTSSWAAKPWCSGSSQLPKSHQGAVRCAVLARADGGRHSPPPA